MINLPTVALCCVTNDFDVEPSQVVLAYSMREIQFAKVLLLSSKPPTNLSNGITYQSIAPLGAKSEQSYINYSRFFIQSIGDYIEANTTPIVTHALFVHVDAFVINPHLWNDDWLKYDYIGAPWGYFVGSHSRVGNGGFSLRSKKIMAMAKNLRANWNGKMNEDTFYCHHVFHIGGNNLKFPTVSEALRFSFEHEYNSKDLTGWNVERDSFGFHRWQREKFIRRTQIPIEKLPSRSLASRKISTIKRIPPIASCDTCKEIFELDIAVNFPFKCPNAGCVGFLADPNQYAGGK